MKNRRLQLFMRRKRPATSCKLLNKINLKTSNFLLMLSFPPSFFYMELSALFPLLPCLFPNVSVANLAYGQALSVSC